MRYILMELDVCLNRAVGISGNSLTVYFKKYLWCCYYERNLQGYMWITFLMFSEVDFVICSKLLNNKFYSLFKFYACYTQRIVWLIKLLLRRTNKYWGYKRFLLLETSFKAFHVWVNWGDDGLTWLFPRLLCSSHPLLLTVSFSWVEFINYTIY